MSIVGLDQADLIGVLDLVRVVGQARDPDEFLRATLRGVMDLVPCLVASMNEVVPMADRMVFWVEPPMFRPPDGVSEALAELAGQHPLIRHAMETGDGSAHRISDFWTQEEFHASPCIGWSTNPWEWSIRCRSRCQRRNRWFWAWR